MPSSMCFENITHYFDKVDPSSPTTERPEEFHNMEPLHCSERFSIYACIMSSSTMNPTRVIVKVARNRKAVRYLAKEYDIYASKLCSLQGTWIPRCYGMYQNINAHGPPACTVLEHCGSPVNCNFANLEKEFKTQFISAAVAIHKLGILLGSIHARSVLNHHGHPKLISFTGCYEHKCEVALPIKEGPISIMPLLSDFKCDELYTLCLDLKIWKPRTVWYMGKKYLSRLVLHPGRLADDTQDIRPAGKNISGACQAARRHLQTHYPDEWERVKDTFEHRTAQLCNAYAAHGYPNAFSPRPTSGRPYGH